MASSRVRRRRRAERIARMAIPVSYRQNSYRAAKKPHGFARVKTRTFGALSWNEARRLADRLQPSKPRKKTSRKGKPAVRSISLVERPLPGKRNRGKGGPCIKRPDPAKAGAASGKGKPKTKEQRLRAFRVWC